MSGKIHPERKTGQHASPLKIGDFHKEMPVISGIHLSVPFIKKGTAKLGSDCAIKHTDKAGSEPKKRNNSVVVAKTLDHNKK